METETIDLLVYGTLRPGEPNDYRLGISGAATGVVTDVVVSGQMRNVRGDTPVFPVVDFTMGGRVVGDVLLGVPLESWEFRSVYGMEIGAGYKLVTLNTPVHIPGSCRTLNNVAAFHYPFENRESRIGIPIPDGDWLAFCEGDHAWRR